MEERDDLAWKKLRHFKICRALLVLAYASLIWLSLDFLVSAVLMLVSPLERLSVTDVGGYFQMDSLLMGGYRIMPYSGLFSSPPENPRLFCAAHLVFYFAANFLPLLILLEYGRRILRAVGENESPFLPQVAILIRRTGWVVIAMGLLSGAVYQVGVNAVAYRRFALILDYFQGTYVLLGCLLLLLADIFRRGCALQQQADETL